MYSLVMGKSLASTNLEIKVKHFLEIDIYVCITQFFDGGNIDRFDAKLAIHKKFPFNSLQ